MCSNPIEACCINQVLFSFRKFQLYFSKPMKIPSSLLKAMVVSAAVSAVATGCTSTKMLPTGENNTPQVSQPDRGTIFDRIHDIFREPAECPACGMG